MDVCELAGGAWFWSCVPVDVCPEVVVLWPDELWSGDVPLEPVDVCARAKAPVSNRIDAS